MKKKVLSLLLVAAMGISMLVGCGGGNDTPADGDTQAAGPEKITLTVWAPENQQELLAKQEADFQAAHPEWEITWVNAAVGEDKARDEVLKDVEAAADVFLYANDQVQDLVAAGALAKLGGETEKMVNDTMAPAVVDTVKVDGAIYGIPFTHNTFFMFYDKSLLADVDITSLDAILAAPTADGVYNFRFDDGGGWKLGAWYYGAGLQVFGADGSDLAAGCDWNSETGVAVTKYIYDMVTNPKVNSADDVLELAKEHKVAAWFTGSWDYETVKGILGDDLGVATIPTYTLNGQEVQLKGFYGSKAIGVNAMSKAPAAAVAFAAYLGSEEQQIARFEATGTVPTNKAASEIDAVKNDPVAAVIVEEANNCSVAQPTSPVFGSRYWNAAGTILSGIKGGTLTADNIQAEMDKFVANITAE
ncbi:MAG: extracellular solute-binding protein [Agathobacter sp.]|nr:extracellular solute-binding protein [Agathobacter sp.]